jgi:hypothetical protein
MSDKLQFVEGAQAARLRSFELLPLTDASLLR